MCSLPIGLNRRVPFERRMFRTDMVLHIVSDQKMD